MANSWSNTFQSSLTLPTGAIAPQQGIYLNGATDTELIYDANGHLIASIAASAGTDGLGNSFPAGISATGGVVSQSIFLLYNGTPAHGNLIASLANQDGIDSFGNHYNVGISTYDPTSEIFSRLNDGVLLLGAIVGGVSDIADAGGLNDSGSGVMKLESSKAGGTSFIDAAVIQLNAGTLNSVSGSGVNPFIRIFDSEDSSAVDVTVSGAVVKSNNGGAATTWQTPSYGTNWLASTTFNGNAGMQPLQYRLDAEDNVHVIGAFKAGGTTPSNPVFMLPAGYRPPAAMPLWCMRRSGATISTGSIYITPGGNFDVFISMGLGINAGDEFLVSGIFPLNNIS